MGRVTETEVKALITRLLEAEHERFIENVIKPEFGRFAESVIDAFVKGALDTVTSNAQDVLKKIEDTSEGQQLNRQEITEDLRGIVGALECISQLYVPKDHDINEYRIHQHYTTDEVVSVELSDGTPSYWRCKKDHQATSLTVPNPAGPDETEYWKRLWDEKEK